MFIIPAFIVSFETIKRFRGLRKVPYKDEFQTKMYACYKERTTRCVFLFWFLSAEVLYFLSYNVGTLLEHFVSSNSNITIGTNCTMEEGTMLSESFSTDPITLLSNLIASLHTSLIVYYLHGILKNNKHKISIWNAIRLNRKYLYFFLKRIRSLTGCNVLSFTCIKS